MKDYYLKFTSEQEANSVLYTVIPEVLDEEGNEVAAKQVKPNYMNIDVLGIIYEPQASTGLADEPVDPVPLDGWHVNVRTINDEDGAALESFKVEPRNPRRTWA